MALTISAHPSILDLQTTPAEAVGPSKEQRVFQRAVERLGVVAAPVQTREVRVRGRDGPDVLGPVELAPDTGWLRRRAGRFPWSRRPESTARRRGRLAESTATARSRPGRSPARGALQVRGATRRQCPDTGPQATGLPRARTGHHSCGKDTCGGHVGSATGSPVLGRVVTAE